MWRRSFLMGLTSVVAIGALAAPTAHEQSRIDKLIHYIATQKDMKFIRNGTEYSCAEAAKFLRGKLESMGGEVTTAREFIDRIGTKSSTSGALYRVMFADGRVMTSAQFLGDELKRMDVRPA